MKKAGIGLDILYVVAGRSASAISAIGIAMVLARLIPTNSFGAYYFALAAANFFSMLSQLGMSQAIIKIGAIFRKDSNRGEGVDFSSAAGGVLCIVTISAAAIALLVFSSWTLLLNSFGAVESLRGHGLAFTAWIFAFSIQLTIADIFRSAGKLNLFAMMSGALSNSLLLSGLLLLMAIGADVDVGEVMTIGNISIAISVLVGMSIARKERLLRFKLISDSIRTIARYRKLAIHSLSAAVFAYLILQTNIWFVARLGSGIEVANFALASRLVATLALINAVIASSLASRVADACVSSDFASRQRLATNICRISVISVVIPALTLLVFGDEIIRLMYGASYPSAAWMARTMAGGYAVAAFFGMRNHFLMMSGGEAIQNSVSVISGIAHAISVFTIMSVAGIELGIAASSIILASTAALEAFILYRKRGIMSIPLALNSKGG
ncbi:hypothetical protein JJQ59_25435 [Cupriavidus necator]|nr:oligosaccharide flippase family protein [Cupriavidus necator]QQX88683.1 hypothetical protein JJQ59_25435 [Cupriavidus necator]